MKSHSEVARDPNQERLQSVAISYMLPKNGTHGELRVAIDGARVLVCEGFSTTHGRFVNRTEAVAVGLAAGQLSPMWKAAQRNLLSSDVNWEGGK